MSAPIKSRKRRVRDFAVSLAGSAALAVLSGCATVIDRPEALADDGSTNKVTFANATDYLNTSQKKLISAYAQAVGYDNAERFSVGGGVAGAGVAAIFHAPTNTVLGLMSFAGLGYTANQTTRPLTTADAYSAGITNLDCIRDAGHNANRALVALLADEARLKGAVTNLKQDVIDAGGDHQYDVAVTQAETAVNAADLLVVAIDNYAATADIGEAMYDGVNRTITAVNDQVRKTQPDIDAIAKSGSILTSLFEGNSDLTTQAQKSASVLSGAVTPVAHGEPTPLQKKFDAQIALINAYVSAIKREIPSVGTAATTPITACQSQFKVITLNPASAITVTAGGDVYNLKATGADASALKFNFSGDAPATADFPSPQPDQNGVFAISVPSKSPARDYQFYVSAKGVGDSQTYKLTVVAPPAAPTPTGTPPAVTPKPGTPTTPTTPTTPKPAPRPKQKPASPTGAAPAPGAGESAPAATKVTKPEQAKQAAGKASSAAGVDKPAPTHPNQPASAGSTPIPTPANRK